MRAAHPYNPPNCPPVKRRKPRQFNAAGDLRHQYKTLDKQREAVYTHGGQLVSHGETVTGRELETRVASVLELEMALRSGDLTNAEREAFQLSLLSGLGRSEIAERLGVSQRRVGNLIGSATHKLVSFVYDQAA